MEQLSNMARQDVARHGILQKGVIQDVRTDKWRKVVLARDDNECQLSKLFGIAKLSGKPCSPDLQVHHRTYGRAGDEIPEDGITVCTRCHDILTDAIRRERASLRETPLIDTPQRIVAVHGKAKDDANIELQDCGREPVAYAQRPVGRPFQYVREEDERNLLQTEEG